MKHHILITGPGRSGTTFLVKILTLLGMDTGFTRDCMPVDQQSQSGLEYQGLGGDLPYVIKNPKLMWQLPQLLMHNSVVIDHVIVPIRDIEAVVASRVNNINKNPDMAPQNVLGGLEGVDRPKDQESFFLKEFYRFFEFLSALNIPVTFLQYPRLVLDGEYLYRKMGLLFDRIERKSFLEAFDELSDPTIVHQYTSDNECHSIKSIDDVDLGQDSNHFLSTRILNFCAELQRLRQQNESLQQQNGFLQQQNESLQQQNGSLQQQNEVVQENIRNILLSRSWRYTKPLRIAMDLIDKRDPGHLTQKLRNLLGLLFSFITRLGNDVSQPDLLNVPYESNFEDNQDFSKHETDIKAIAFYLPQFHQIPENDHWWGEGFTEWVNTKKAKPLFEGHYQPREPHDDIGYYDLSNVDVLIKQSLLARQHGIYGFCFYHYYFHGKRLLQKPVDMLLEHPEIDINFCLCWANENWTKKWDGAEHEILIAQKHSAEDDINFIKDLSRYLKDPRYIKSDGKPVVLIYRPLLLPSPGETFARWRDYSRRSGIGEIAIWGVRGCYNQETGLGLEDALEAEVEFPPHLPAPLKWIPSYRISGSRIVEPLVDYKALVNNIISHRAVVDKLPYPVYRTAMLGWDNTARRTEKGYVFYGFSTHLYYKWLCYNIRVTRKNFQEDNRFVFINSWNEWGEGPYLEPDKKHGYANINVTSKALFDLPYSLKEGDAAKKKGRSETLLLKELIDSRRETDNLGRIAVHAHIFYTDLTHELVYYMNNIPVDFDCFITTDTEIKKQEIEDKIRHRLNTQNVEIRVTPNIGRDVAPFLVGCRDIMNLYDYVCHIHTKKSVHNGLGDPWREYLLDHLLGSHRLVTGILDYFARHPEIGLIYPPVFSSVEELAIWGGNLKNVQLLLRRVGAEMELPDIPQFPAGTMFWMRAKAFEKLFEAGFTYEDFEEETGQLDGTLAHAFERSLAYIVDQNGYSSRKIAKE